MKKTKVRSEVFPRETIQNILDSIDSANKDLADQLKDIPGVAIYRKGWRAAMGAVARAIGTKQKGGGA